MKRSGREPAKFAQILYPDSPPGELRHLFCSLKVAPDSVERFNRALHASVR